MKTLFRSYRWKKAKDWLPFERQLHEMLLHEPALVPIHRILKEQFDNLWEANRSIQGSTLTTHYSYQTDSFWPNTGSFVLAEIAAENCSIVIEAGGGMLASSSLRLVDSSTKPLLFTLERPSLHRVFPPVQELPIDVGGWIEALEDHDLLQRAGQPRTPFDTGQLSFATEYFELFATCAEASVRIGDELYHFLEPSKQASLVRNGFSCDYLPIIDLRESGGVAAVPIEGAVRYALFENGECVWQERSLVQAIERLQKQAEQTGSSNGG